jgi:hypothetical protein
MPLQATALLQTNAAQLMELLTAAKSNGSPPPKTQVTSDRAPVPSLIVIRKWRSKVLENLEISVRLAKEVRQKGCELQPS